MKTKIMLPLGKRFRRLLIAGSFTAVTAGVFFILLLTLPLVVFEGDLLNGSVAISWYELKNYGEPVDHPGLTSITFLSIPVFTTAFFSISIGLLTIFKISRDSIVSHTIVELLLGALEACVIFTSVFYSLRLNVIHAVSVLPAQVGGAGSAGLLVIQGSARSETFTSTVIRQFYPLVFANILFTILVVIIGYEAARALEAATRKEQVWLSLILKHESPVWEKGWTVSKKVFRPAFPPRRKPRFIFMLTLSLKRFSKNKFNS
ncbi:MAG: hypothetical protein FGF53_09500 [Candidatus Brockarchaeota archaeon]|nr:hypothetical protein [Candidatus Brockarchaeota archaeon]MBO3809417.1 hypothetical protein [Candidatus Brockarchaeota archaeon]